MIRMIIVKCEGKECISEFQDKLYGKGKRICNLTKDDRGRCTVCGTINNIPKRPMKKGGKK